MDDTSESWYGDARSDYARNSPSWVAVQYRGGLVRESFRVVHFAVPVAGAYRTLCSLEIPFHHVEHTKNGMPCMQCTLRGALVEQEVSTTGEN